MATVPNLRMEPPPRSLAADAQDRIMVRIEADPPNTRLRRRAPPALHGSPRIPRPASVTLDHRGEQRQPDVAYEHDEPFRSKEHTSALQSLMRIPYTVFCLKRKKLNIANTPITTLITQT